MVFSVIPCAHILSGLDTSGFDTLGLDTAGTAGAVTNWEQLGSLLAGLWSCLYRPELIWLPPAGAPALGADNNPNTPTPFVVPTYTLPLAIIGVMNLLPAPK